MFPFPIAESSALGMQVESYLWKPLSKMQKLAICRTDSTGCGLWNTKSWRSISLESLLILPLSMCHRDFLQGRSLSHVPAERASSLSEALASHSSLSANTWAGITWPAEEWTLSPIWCFRYSTYQRTNFTSGSRRKGISASARDTGM